MNINPGMLVNTRNRDWVVLPSDNKDLLILKPLGGSENETTGIYLPLNLDEIKSAKFDTPTSEDIGDITSARILYDAARLSFRNGAGPFRALAKISFRPRAYQVVPLVMALKQENVRLLIADDVGVGKTIEALLIIQELLSRKKIKRFAIVCLPHLCEQWQSEIKDKLGLDTVIIRSNTQARLDRQIHGDISVYQYYPYQIISIDYIKAENRKDIFTNECPELIIVDEAHTCAKPSGTLKSQQQRHHLLTKIADKDNQHLILLTATPHSGKNEEFQSLLSLIKKGFENLDLAHASSGERRHLAKHFIQRRRADVKKWMDEETLFPERDAGEFDYSLSTKYLAVFDKVLTFARRLIKGDELPAGQKRIQYWTALALLRGVMSSPATGIEMLNHRLEKLDYTDDNEIEDENPVYDQDFGFESDVTPVQVFQIPWTKYQQEQLRDLTSALEALANIKEDQKAAHAELIIDDWLRSGFNPVVFCRYIPTANYLGTLIKPILERKHRNLQLLVITSEDPDEVRKQRIDSLNINNPRVIIATDCLSEGINLQQYFTAVLHYDLPWNPNRLEQREGRIDRFGQNAPIVKTFMLYGRDNPIDGVVLDVIIRKVKEIRKSIKISLPFPEDSKSVLDTVLHSILLNPERRKVHETDIQLEFDFGDIPEVQEQKLRISRMIDEAAQREEISRSIFAQNAIQPDEIEPDLRENDEAIGNPEAVQNFVQSALQNVLGVQINSYKEGYRIYTTNLPYSLKGTLPNQDVVNVSFKSPTPEGYIYLGRNHVFIEQLCQHILANAMDRNVQNKANRTAIIRSKVVDTKTTIIMFRVRNVIEDRQKRSQIVAEEMLLWGYKGVPTQREFLIHQEAKELLSIARVSNGLTLERQISTFESEIEIIREIPQTEFNKIAESRCKHLVEAHERFSQLLDKRKFDVVYPVLPMDILGIYIILPDII